MNVLLVDDNSTEFTNLRDLKFFHPSPQISSHFFSSETLTVFDGIFSTMICSLIPFSRPRAQKELLRTFQLMTLEQIPRTYHSQGCAAKCEQLDILVETMRSKLPLLWAKVSLCRNLGRDAKYQQAGTSTTTANSTACPSFVGQHCFIFTDTMQIMLCKRKPSGKCFGSTPVV